MWKKRYSRKIKVVSILITVSFVLLIAATLSKGGILALNHNDYTEKIETEQKLREDKKQYTVIPGDIYDEKGETIVAFTQTIDKAKCHYHKSYSHLLGNFSLNDNAYLNSNKNILLHEQTSENTKNKGTSFFLTINDDLQRFAYSLTEGEQASIVALKRHSGDILALTSTYSQSFDLGGDINPEDIDRYNNSSEPIWTPDYLNKFPPGSCMKIFSSAVAFETGNGGFAIDDTGSVDYNGDKLYNCDGIAYGANEDINKAFTVSSNVYFASLFNNLDIGDIRKLSDKMWLNKSFNTDFGTFTNSFSFGDYSSFDIGLLGIGQKNELSAVGLAIMTQGIIDNEMYYPHVTKEACYKTKNGSFQVVHTTTRGSYNMMIKNNIFSEETCSQVRQLMENAARSDEYGLSDNIIGAKTGTAELEIEGTLTGRANMVAYDENYIVVVSKAGNSFGISNKEIIEKLFKKLDDIS